MHTCVVLCDYVFYVSRLNDVIKFFGILINLSALIKVASTSSFTKKWWIKPHVAT